MPGDDFQRRTWNNKDDDWDWVEEEEWDVGITKRRMDDQTVGQRPDKITNAGPPVDYDAEDALEHTEVWNPDETPGALLPLCWLVVSRPLERRGTIIQVQPNDLIGRGKDASIRWDDPRMSRIHARFTLEADPRKPDDDTQHYVVWSVGARNGIYVNDTLMPKAHQLKENDIIRMGDTVMVVKLLT